MQRLLMILAAAVCLSAADARANVHRSGYAVVVSEEAYADADWKRVVDCLKRKHSGTVITYSKMVDDSLADLKRLFPKYACFVGPPEEITREFVAQVHRLTRRLDDDPYTDVIWGIITGYESADALRIAKHGEPLAVRRALSATVGAQIDGYDEGRMYNELAAGTIRQ